MIRNSLRFASWKDQRTVIAALKPIYGAETEEAAEEALEALEKGIGRQYPMVARSWRANWERVIPFLAFPKDIRKAIYTNERDRVAELPTPKDNQDSRAFPDGRRSNQAALPCAGACSEEMDNADQNLEERIESIRCIL